jgi:predicted transcriptional regulator of viral defense system
MTNTKMLRVRKVFTDYGPVVKMNILRENKLFSRDIAELISLGFIRKLKAGYYVWTAAQEEISDLELACAVIPKGIICLQSAAHIHELTTLIPMSITIALPSDSMRPILPVNPPIELIMTPPKLFELGLVVEEGSQGELRIYDRERTVCDFFRKRNVLGEDLALETLRSYMNGKRRIQLLMDYAKKLRLKTVITPYVEALL